MNIPLLDLKAQYATIRDEIRAAVDRVLESQQFILGPEVEALEREVAAYSQCEFGIGISSGTDAILAALMAIGIQPGDEVIMPPYTFFATAGCVTRLGAKPVFVDIDRQTFNINHTQIEAAIKKNDFSPILDRLPLVFRILCVPSRPAAGHPRRPRRRPAGPFLLLRVRQGDDPGDRPTLPRRGGLPELLRSGN